MVLLLLDLVVSGPSAFVENLGVDTGNLGFTLTVREVLVNETEVELVVLVNDDVLSVRNGLFADGVVDVGIPHSSFEIVKRKLSQVAQIRLSREDLAGDFQQLDVLVARSFHHSKHHFGANFDRTSSELDEGLMVVVEVPQGTQALGELEQRQIGGLQGKRGLHLSVGLLENDIERGSMQIQLLFPLGLLLEIDIVLDFSQVLGLLSEAVLDEQLGHFFLRRRREGEGRDRVAEADAGVVVRVLVYHN